MATAAVGALRRERSELLTFCGDLSDVAGLRVADASALPRILRANTNAPAITIGERCADFMLLDLWIVSSRVSS